MATNVLTSDWQKGRVLTVLDGCVKEYLQARQMEDLFPLGLVVDLGLFSSVAKDQ